MRRIELEESKEIMLKMLEEIDAFCRANDIQYFLTGGTLIGAVRHKGFIPWDDDIDIAFPRKDYERLLKEFRSTSGDVDILNYKNKDHFIWPAAKIVNNKTVLIESKLKKASIGIYLDMFPLDYIAGDLEEAKAYANKVFRWKNLLTLKYMRVSKSRSFIKNAVVLAAKMLYIIPDRFILRKIEMLSRKFENQSDCEYLCNLSGAWGTKEVVNKHIFDKAIDWEFEGKNFRIPIGYDEMLTNIYGDYMKLPPVEKRVSTHTAESFWKEQ